MKFYLSIIFLTLTFFVNVIAQDSEEISQLKPVRKPTKAELKKIKKLSKDIVDGFGWDIIEISMNIESKTLANGKKVSVIKAEFNRNELFFKETEKGGSVASVNIFGRVTSNDEKFSGTFEDILNFTKKEQADKPDTLFYQKIFELPEGKYKLQIAVRDAQTGKIGIKIVKFEVN